MHPDVQITLDQLTEFGIGQAEFLAADDACPVCLALGGKVFDAKKAPVIPVPSCENERCRCDYAGYFPPDSN